MPYTARADSDGLVSRGVTRGREGVDGKRDGVMGIQRARLLTAMIEVACEDGAANVTVADVVARARISRRTFYDLFDDREECFLAAFDGAVANASRCVFDAYDPDAGWAERIRTSLIALLEFLERERGAGQLLIVGALGAGTEALERRRRVIGQIVALVDEGRTAMQAGSSIRGQVVLPLLTAEGVVGGVLSVLHGRLSEKRQLCLVELAGPLMSMIVLPYLGPAAARRELSRPVPKPHQPNGRAAGDPLRELGMRLTYRTVRVLLAVAADPRSSNREIGEAAGISDQGQMSKLLSRLERLGLVQNTGLAPGKGAPNAWTLTTKGIEVQQAMSSDPSGCGDEDAKRAMSSIGGSETGR